MSRGHGTGERALLVGICSYCPVARKCVREQKSLKYIFFFQKKQKVDEFQFDSQCYLFQVHSRTFYKKQTFGVFLKCLRGCPFPGKERSRRRRKLCGYAQELCRRLSTPLTLACRQVIVPDYRLRWAPHCKLQADSRCVWRNRSAVSVAAISERWAGARAFVVKGGM